MKTTVNFSDFRNAFKQCGREGQFSEDGQKALFDFLEGYEEAAGEEIELDPIALCCEYTEYSDAEEVIKAYSSTFESEDLEDLDEDDMVELINEHTLCLQFDTGIIIMDF